MLISLNIEISSVNIFRLFRINLTSFALILINILLIIIQKSVQLNSFNCFALTIFHLIIILTYSAMLTAILYLTLKFSHNRIVSTSRSQSFCHLNDEKFRNYKQLKFALNEFV